MERDYLLKNKNYNRLKNSLVIIPLIAAAYYGLALIWGLPKADEVTGTATVVVTLLGGLMKAAEKSYDKSEARFDGILEVGTEKNRFEFNDTLEELEKKDSVTFKVSTNLPGNDG